MLTPRFQALFDQLVAAFVRYQEASRHVDDVTELARRRFELESLRSAIAHERMAIEGIIPTGEDVRWLAEIGVRFA